MVKTAKKHVNVAKVPKVAQASTDNNTLLLIAICSVLVGVMFGKLDTWITESLVDANEWYGIVILVLVALAFAYAWLGGILLVRLFVKNAHKR